MKTTWRSWLVQVTAGVAAAGALVGAAFMATTVRAQEAKPLTVGFIYVGSHDDFGYNQAQAEGAALAKAMPGIKIVEAEQVPKTVAVQKTMESMIQLNGGAGGVERDVFGAPGEFDRFGMELEQDVHRVRAATACALRTGSGDWPPRSFVVQWPSGKPC